MGTLRCAELKHGRVAMLASLGLVVQHFIQLNGFSKVPPGIGAPLVQPGGTSLLLLVLLAGVVETTVWAQDPEKEPGDFGDPLELMISNPFDACGYTEETRNKELNNGRFAMISVPGILIAEINS